MQYTEAMLRAYLTHFHQLSRNVKLFLLGNALQAMGLSIYGLLFNLYLKHLGFGEAAIGTMISTTSLGVAMIAIPAALVIDRMYVKHLVVTGMFFTSAFYCFQILHTDEASLFSYGLLASMFLAVYNISVSPFYLRNSTPESRVHLFSLNSSLNMGSHLVGYLVGGYLPSLAQHLWPSLERVEAYRAAIWAALALVVLSNLLFMQIRRVPLPRPDKQRLFQGLKDKEWAMLSRLILPKLCFAFGGGLVVPFINLYLKSRFSLSVEMIGVAYALLQLFIFLGIFVTPSLMRRTTKIKFILYTSLFSIPFMVGMGLTGNITLVLSCFFMRGMLMNMSGPITSVFEMEHVREKECVFASAIILFFYHLVYTASTRLGGMMIEEFSFGPTFYMAAASYTVAIVLYYRFFREEVQEQPARFNRETRATDAA